MFAGHGTLSFSTLSFMILSGMMIWTETTACVLKATLGYLGIYQDEQAKSYEEITSTIPHGQDLVRD